MTNVRQFTLINGNGQQFDITSKDYLLTSPSGLGYDRTESYRQIGNSFIRVSKKQKQGSISGTLVLTPPDAYDKFYSFIQAVSVEPLTLMYKPSDFTYYREVSLSKVEKSELTKYASLECGLTLTCLSPWYRKISFSPSEVTKAGNLWPIAWPKLWGQGNTMAIEFDSDSFLDSPCKLIVNGHCKNPSWIHYVNGKKYEQGSITCEVEDNNYLVVDNTQYPYSMKIYDSDNNVVRDVYSSSDFSSERFMSIQNGHNIIAISNDLGSEIKIRAEVYLQYEAV